MTSTSEAVNAVGLERPQVATDDEPHLMRISSAKMHAYVEWALKFLQENKYRPLVLHTLPVPSSRLASEPPQEAETPNAASTTNKRTEKNSMLSHCTTSIPRLVSIVETIKRVFAASMIRHNLDNPESPILLHQYNLVDSLESEASTNQEGNVTIDLESVLSGKNHLQVKKTPYMKVILCRRKLPQQLVGKASYQEPLMPPKKSRSTKSRERKRRRKQARDAQAASAEQNAVPEVMEVDPSSKDS
ncbi:uncharacterized protein EI90DRAFT_2291931 [Cantharellus anzutake]|uniref:uncharacterized protein n=1 Tax=Cantharellus anzutake TaxID=1750568 RepID=UPI001904D71B|nr:uncharacterized protein EI90DRAFT_2291931 [Cantharellus anzutake]KAF8339850.1 hypothetical protein EI90DRAFT_2291931 [Cantharellus anzutake]